MGFFGRNNKQQQQQQQESVLQAKEEYVVEVQDVNHEHRHTSTKPKKQKGKDKKMQQEQVYVKESATEDSAEVDEELEVDLAAFREVVPETTVQQKQKPTKDNRRMKLIAALLVLFAVILAVVLSVTLTLTGRDDTPGVINVPAVEEEPEPDYNSNEAAYLMEILGVYTAVNVLVDDSVPQGQAFLELLLDEQAASQRTPPLRVEQRYALQVLYRSTSPEEWTNSAGWNTAELDECSWNGVETCTFTDEEGVMAVSSVALESNNLMGTIPTELCILGNNLQQLNLAQNLLQGDVPECLCDLENLETFNAAGNALGGTIPNCVVEAANLATLDLANNQMTGTIPPFAVTSLKNINISNNQLTGKLDGLFVAASNFEPVFVELHLDNNQFIGTVPDLSEVLSLTHFTVTENQLTGELTFCRGFSALEQLEVDCLEVDCACCTNCDDNYVV